MLTVRQRGQAVIETALTLTVFLSAMMGVMDFGRAAYTYNAVSNLAREASHYAMIEYTSDSTSPCYWSTFDSDACLTAIKSHIASLNMSPGISASSLSVTMTIQCGDGTACSPGIPVDVSLSTRFSPVALVLLGINAFSISASSTSEFVVPPSTTATPTATPQPTANPSTTATPLPTPTVVPQGPPTNVTVTPTDGCNNNCEEFKITWTSPANTAALGHYNLEQSTPQNGVQADDPLPPSLGGTAVTRTTIDVGTTVNSVCFKLSAVFTDASDWPATGMWHNGSTSAPSCP